jgi:SSS family solute:Na+ symporter
MQFIDWVLTATPLAIVVVIAIYANSYVRSVADFMSGGRSAGRYLLAIAGNEMQAGAVVFVATFEAISHAGFSIAWWGLISVPVVIILSITGFVIYRFRETRAMTLAQFFEIRYSKSVRLFAGILGFIAGILNFGIIPGIGARCLVYFLGLPANLTLFSHTVPTYIPLMALFLSVTVTVALAGGIITVMLTNCVEGIMSQIIYLIIIVSLLSIFNWSQISYVLGNRPPGQSLLNPFDSSGIKDFNLWYVLMGVFTGAYATMAWQNASAYNSAALTAHESRMASILGRWRDLGKGAVVTLLGVCAVTFLHHPDFAAQARVVEATVQQIADPQAREQMEAPIAMANFVPVGVRGLLCAILLMGIFGGDATHLHSWGSIFVQDVLVPLRKRPFGVKEHIFALRLSIGFVALFAFIFGCLFSQTEYINMWWSVTTSVFVAGTGSVIIGGLYWKKATAAGAWTAMVLGGVLSLGGIIARQIYREGFPLNGVQIFFFSVLICIVTFIAVSLLTCREDFNMDRMLHRGTYAVPRTAVEEQEAPTGKCGWLGRLMGMDDNFTLGDKWIAGGIFGWSVFFFFVFVLGTIWNLIAPWPLAVWSIYWEVTGIGAPIAFALLIGVWFTWGGIKDIRVLFARLRQEKINHRDDGTVIDHKNLDEVAADTTPRH